MPAALPRPMLSELLLFAEAACEAGAWHARLEYLTYQACCMRAAWRHARRVLLDLGRSGGSDMGSEVMARAHSTESRDPSLSAA
eukprot:6214053-Pleurochrysis_carterae.AAC.6